MTAKAPMAQLSRLSLRLDLDCRAGHEDAILGYSLAQLATNYFRLAEQGRAHGSFAQEVLGPDGFPLGEIHFNLDLPAEES